MSILVPEQHIDVTLSANNVKMFMVQPYLEFENPLQEPFPLTPACTQKLLDSVDHVFEMYVTFRPQIILIPEFTLPGVDGVERIINHLSTDTVDSPTIVVAGVSGLSKDEYSRLCALTLVSSSDAVNAPNRVADTQWVNASVTFIKSNAGTLSLWIQAKIVPSWPEDNARYQSMFRGRVVRVFRAAFDNGVPCRFLSLLCYDWIGYEDGVAVPDIVLQQFGEASQKSGSQQDLQWAFVLQHNPTPNHHSFLGATTRFLTQNTHPFARRKDAAVLMICTASSVKPARGGPYGYSSVICGPQAPFDVGGCRPTFATQSARLRNSTVLGTCKDAVFREMGECVHEATIRIPNWVIPDVTDRTPALADAIVLPLLGAVEDPRIPGDAVAAVIKWTNDELDDVPDLCAIYFAGAPIEEQLRAAQTATLNAYRHLPSQELAIRLDGACANRAEKGDSGADPACDIDTHWGVDERCGLQHVVQTLTLIGSIATLNIPGSQLHAREDETGVEIVAINGATHAQCNKAYKRLAPRTHAPVLLVTRDANNVSQLPREVREFADPHSDSGLKTTDSQTLWQSARTQDVPQYAQFITELLNVEDKRII
jgi:hypothetical protein